MLEGIQLVMVDPPVVSEEELLAKPANVQAQCFANIANGGAGEMSCHSCHLRSPLCPLPKRVVIPSFITFSREGPLVIHPPPTCLFNSLCRGLWQ